MKLAIAAITIILSSIAPPALAAKSCDELKQEIAAKLDAKGVKEYTLDIVASDAAQDRSVVGSCAGGTQRIVYQRSKSLDGFAIGQH
jgi:Protein of unknown function (DUF1161)